MSYTQGFKLDYLRLDEEERLRRCACLRPCFVLRGLGLAVLYLRVFLALRFLCLTLAVPWLETVRLDFGELLRFLRDVTAALTSGTAASGANSIAFALMLTFGTYSFSSFIFALRLYRTIGTSFPSIEFLFSLNTLLRLFTDDLPLERAL